MFHAMFWHNSISVFIPSARLYIQFMFGFLFSSSKKHLAELDGYISDGGIDGEHRRLAHLLSFLFLFSLLASNENSCCHCSYLHQTFGHLTLAAFPKSKQRPKKNKKKTINVFIWNDTRKHYCCISLLVDVTYGVTCPIHRPVKMAHFDWTEKKMKYNKESKTNLKFNNKESKTNLILVWFCKTRFYNKKRRKNGFTPFIGNASKLQFYLVVKNSWYKYCFYFVPNWHKCSDRLWSFLFCSFREPANEVFRGCVRRN